MTGAKGPPESVSRQRTPIPQQPEKDRLRGIRGEIARVRTYHPELEIVLQHMLDEIEARENVIWQALDILDKRFNEFETEPDIDDTEFIEQTRATQRRRRKVESDDGDITITVLDVVTQTVTVKGNRTGKTYKFIFNEPLPE